MAVCTDPCSVSPLCKHVCQPVTLSRKTSGLRELATTRIFMLPASQNGNHFLSTQQPFKSCTLLTSSAAEPQPHLSTSPGSKNSASVYISGLGDTITPTRGRVRQHQLKSSKISVSAYLSFVIYIMQSRMAAARSRGDRRQRHAY